MSARDSTIQRYIAEDPDVRLMLRVQGGDTSAFDVLVQQYQTRLITILAHLVGNQQQAEDLAQEVFMRAFRARHRYQAEAKFSTWLFTIANRAASNARRSRNRRGEVHLPSRSDSASRPQLATLAQEKSGLMPARQLERREMREMVHLALQGLNERQRMVILLAKFEGMSYAEIADTMEMSQKAIKSLLSRARLNLKQLLQPYIQADPAQAAVSEPEEGE